MDATRLVYITCKDKQEAMDIAKQVVMERLAACGNILDPMESIYWWEGKVQTDSETVLILKTRAENTEKLSRRVQELHSYDEPCVVWFNIEGGSPTYLDWILKETRS